MNTQETISIIGVIIILIAGIFIGTFILIDNRRIKINFIAYPLAILCYLTSIVGSIFIIYLGFLQ